MFLDESGFSLIPYVAKTWAPIGQTPVILHQGRWPKFSAISGITPAGRLYFNVHNPSIKGPQVIEFLEHLKRHIRRRPMMIFWDSGPHHRSKLVTAYLAKQRRLEVHRFPGYSPELNPDGYEPSARHVRPVNGNRECLPITFPSGYVDPPRSKFASLRRQLSASGTHEDIGGHEVLNLHPHTKGCGRLTTPRSGFCGLKVQEREVRRVSPVGGPRRQS
jgi:hypothetical protein